MFDNIRKCAFSVEEKKGGEAPRVGIYLQSFSGGGAERELVYIANELVKRGCQVDLFIHDGRGPLESLVDERVDSTFLNNCYLSDVAFLSSYMRRCVPDHVMSSMHVPNWILSFAKAFSLKKIDISWRVVTNLTHSLKNRGVKFEFLYKTFYKLLSIPVNNIVCVSRGVENDLNFNIGVGRDKTITIYNPAYSEIIQELSCERAEHHWFDDGYKVVIAIGRLAKEKNYANLIESFSAVVEEVEDARLLIVGDGPQRKSLLDLIIAKGLQDHVELYGFDINPYKYLARAKVCVVSSIFEGFGNVIVEALALDIPVVSTDCPSGPSEILENGKWGRLVPVNDHAHMSREIVSVLKKSLAPKTNERARFFSIENVVDNYFEKIF